MAEDYYSILEVDRNASQDDIKRAYRRLAMKYHPDRNQGDKAAEEKFKQIGTAYEVLGDEEKKRIYDQVGHERYTQAGGAAGGPGGPGGIHFDFGDMGDLGDIFGEMFGGGRRRQRQRDPNAPVKGEDLQYHLTISFEEAVYGADKDISFSIDDTCPRCHGSGGEPGSKRQTCPTCKGRGQVMSSRGFFQMATTCPTCHGTGYTLDHVCTECHGSTQKRTSKKVSFHIPAGVDNGSRIRVAGEGLSGRMGGASGDLFIEIEVREHNIFKRNDLNLYCEVPISFTTAALGGEITVPTIYGPTTFKVPAGTQNGKQFRIAGKGVQSPRSSRKGDLYVAVQIEVPVNLTNEQKELLTKFAASCNETSHPFWRSFMDKAKSFFSKHS
ncbi:MAG: molecular chaperone DnaJ [Victivallales bacterium]|nr:molecular chaperone DnaJ [Victivallales bacterium]